MIWMPTVSAVEEVHYGLVALFEKEEDPVSPAGIKSADMLASACSRPHTGIGNTDKYDTLYRKAAALFHSLTKNHPFHNGNKRTALITLLTTLSRNDRRLKQDVNDDEIFDFVVAVTADEFPNATKRLEPDAVVEEIAKWLKERTVAKKGTTPGMTTSEFISRCKQAGVKYKQAKGGTHCLLNGMGVRISQSTKQLDGGVVRQYLKRLKLNELQAGFGVDEFQQGTSLDREQIYRYMAALKRLAKT
ncbi:MULTISPECIES: type II toxin-antitoxin system death-on-curing family toxin [Polaromonas]|uniref:Type II toxin-antitoxin system death-on-curing family toxin n=1 Tax=Polaromonas aquatica TaxID=332657 RepID=A0ABW1TZQ1_9BURK